MSVEHFVYDAPDDLTAFQGPEITSGWNIPTSAEEYQLAIDGAQAWLRALHEVPSGYAPLAPTHERSVPYEGEALSRHLARTAIVAPGYAAFIQALGESLPPMDPRCRLSVTMPARQEGNSIFQALEQMLVQTSDGRAEPAQRSKDGSPVDPSTYEINIGINHDASGDDTGTREAVAAFAEAYSLPLNVNVTDVTLPPSYANVGMARKIVQDVTFWRANARQEQSGPLYIAAEEADVVGYDERAFDAYIRHLDAHPENFAVRHRLYRDVFALKEGSPYLHLQQRLVSLALAMVRSRQFQPPHNPHPHRFSVGGIIGYGTALAAADMANVGGFPIVKHSEDMLLGEYLAIFHGSEQAGRFLPARQVGRESAIVMGSARRQLASYAADIQPYEGFGDTASPMTQLSRKSIAELAELTKLRDPVKARQDFNAMAQSVADMLLVNAPTEKHATKAMRFILEILGFQESDYRLTMTGDSASLTLDQWDNVEALARQYTPNKRLQASVRSVRP